MNRYLHELLTSDLKRKMVFVTGPRQVGKTTLAKQIGEQFTAPLYLNFDSAADRKSIIAADWLPRHDYVVLDEIHSMSNWKEYLKGVYDTKPKTQALLVTGSARLDTFRQTGKSLAGRYFRARLNPFSVKELVGEGKLSANDRDMALDHLMRFGGFPEPLFEATEAGRKRWQNQYFTDLVREDILEFSRIHEIKVMRDLIELLRGRTGSPLSFDALSRDLSIAPNTVKNYVQILEALHIVFLIKPYHRNIARAMARAPKLYFYDWAYVRDTQTSDAFSGARFENLVACHLLKHAQFLTDSQGELTELNYLRTTSGKEIDFVLSNDQGHATHFIEAKLSDVAPSYALKEVSQTHPVAKAIQIVLNAKRGRVVGRVEIVPASIWLGALIA